ncbi:MAG: right-handed parallel beta-helix repeat-containing protein [Planctomycetaceae bacterium]|nr:right-handed parallel beta-helix repeat-containing protein [Planctomycetaceae bacterium]
MTRTHFISSVVLAVLVVLIWKSADSISQEKPAGLPGARPAIDAAQYPSLQAAIDALPASGGEIRLPAGTFEISVPLLITQEDVLIEGAGTATHIKNVNQAGQPAIVIQSPSLAENPRATRWRVQLENLRVTGNEKSGHGILARRIDEFFLHGVTVSYHGGDGVRLDNCYEDPRICDSLFTYNKACGVNLIGCHDIVVVGNQFEENLDALRCADSFNLCMTGNNLDDHLRDGVVIENTYGSVVSGNMIEECNGRAIVLDRDCYGITLSANVIAHEVQGGIDLIDAHGCAVSANTFTIVKKDALRIGPASSRITVAGNNFSSSHIGDGVDKRGESDRSAAGIVLAGTSDIAISGNLFSGLSTKAVALEGDKPAARVSFTGNLLTDVTSDVSPTP